MKVRVEFLLTHKHDVYDVAQIPCIGEMVALDNDSYDVVNVMHILNADPATQYLAIVRVK